MFVNVSTLVAALLMIIVPFLQEVKAIATELARDKSKVEKQKNVFKKFETDPRWTTSPATRLFSNLTMNLEQNQKNWVGISNDHHHSIDWNIFILLSSQI